MNKYLRLFWIIFFAKFKKKLSVDAKCETNLIVMPNDLDLLLHMNNGVYLTLQDIARTEYTIRTGLDKVFKNKGWYPVLAAETIRFQRSLKLFQKFTITTQYLGNDEKFIYIEHSYRSKGKIISTAIVKTRFLSKDGRKITPHDVLTAGGMTAEQRPPQYVETWNQADSELWSLYGDR